MFHYSIAHDHDCGPGLRCNLPRPLRGAQQRRLGTSQIRVTGLFNRFCVHRSLQSSSRGMSPELSYSAQKSAIGA